MLRFSVTPNSNSSDRTRISGTTRLLPRSSRTAMALGSLQGLPKPLLRARPRGTPRRLSKPLFAPPRVVPAGRAPITTGPVQTIKVTVTIGWIVNPPGDHHFREERRDGRGESGKTILPVRTNNKEIPLGIAGITSLRPMRGTSKTAAVGHGSSPR